MVGGPGARAVVPLGAGLRRTGKACCCLLSLYTASVVIAALVLPSVTAQSGCVCNHVIHTFPARCAGFHHETVSPPSSSPSLPPSNTSRCEIEPFAGAFAVGMSEESSWPSDGVCLLTGGSGGIGKATAEGLAATRRCRLLYLTGHSPASAAAAAADVGRSTGHHGVVGLPLDLSSLADVQRFAQQFARLNARLDLLILNAGSFGPKGGVITKDGFEQTFQVCGCCRRVCVVVWWWDGRE